MGDRCVHAHFKFKIYFIIINDIVIRVTDVAYHGYVEIAASFIDVLHTWSWVDS